MSLFTVSRCAESLAHRALTLPQATPGPHPDPGRRAAGRLRPVSRQGTRATPSSVSATIFRDGHDMLRAVVRYRRAGTRRWREARSSPVGNDRWEGRFDGADARPLAVHDRGLGRPRTRRGSTSSTGSSRPGRSDLSGELPRPRRCSAPATRRRRGTGARPARRKDRHGKASLAASARGRRRARARALRRVVRALPALWGGFEGVQKVLPELAELGFDVVYLPPIHPIGTTNRKGRNNALVGRATGDPGSPWAIGGRGGRPRRDPPGARHAEGLRRGWSRRRASTGSRSRSTSRSSARPTTRG